MYKTNGKQIVRYQILSPNISAITLNVNKINTLIKSRWSNWIEKLMLFTREDHLIYKDVESSGKSVIETLLFNLEMLVYFFFFFAEKQFQFSYHIKSISKPEDENFNLSDRNNRVLICPLVEFNFGEYFFTLNCSNWIFFFKK